MARPIPIDRDAVRRFAAGLQEQIKLWAVGRDDSGEGLVVVPRGPDCRAFPQGLPFTLRDTRGQMVTAYVRVVTSMSRSPEYIVYGGIGVIPATGDIGIALFLNARYSPATIWKSASGSDLIASQIYDVLIHEFTHAADAFRRAYKREMTREQAQENLAAYFNEPSEVAAYLRNVLEEIEPFVQNTGKLQRLFGPSKGVEVLLNLSETWKWASPHWSKKNQQKVINAVVARLAEAGFSRGRTRAR